MLESDFVVVVPGGSATVELSDDLERQTRDMASLGPTLAPGDRESLVDRLRLMRDEGGQVAVVSGRDVCAYAVFPALSIEYLVALANLDRQYLGERVLPPVGPATLVELSVGPAIVAEGAWADGGEWATYAGRSGSAAFTISCSGVDENDDSWRSFADALVWLEQL